MKTTTLGILRGYTGWQDAGETGENDSLTDDLKVVVRDDGSVGVVGCDGVLVQSGDVDDQWYRWLHDQGLVEGTERCAYCGGDIPLGVSEDVPDASDDDAWSELAEHHYPECEWIVTRAHRSEAQ